MHFKFTFQELYLKHCITKHILKLEFRAHASTLHFKLAFHNCRVMSNCLLGPRCCKFQMIVKPLFATKLIPHLSNSTIDIAVKCWQWLYCREITYRGYIGAISGHIVSKQITKTAPAWDGFGMSMKLYQNYSRDASETYHPRPDTDNVPTVAANLARVHVLCGRWQKNSMWVPALVDHKRIQCECRPSLQIDPDVGVVVITPIYHWNWNGLDHWVGPIYHWNWNGLDHWMGHHQLCINWGRN